MTIAEYLGSCKDFIKKGPVKKIGYVLAGLGFIVSCSYLLPKCTHENDGDSRKNECVDTNCDSTVYNINNSIVNFSSDGKTIHSIGKRGRTYVRKHTETSSRVGHCGKSLCSTPEEYSGATVACTGYDHCGTGDSDSEHELLISEEGLDRKVLEIVSDNISYLNGDTIQLNYKQGFNGPGNGVRLSNLFGVVQDADNCSKYKKINIGEEIPEGFEIVMLYGYDNNGNLYRIASSYIGKGAPVGRRNTKRSTPTPKVEKPSPQPKPTSPLVSEAPVSLEGLVNPTLTDNKWNEAGFKTGIAYDAIILAFCEGGTDGNGKITKGCTDFIKEDFPEAIKFSYIKIDNNDNKVHIYRGYIPNIPGTGEGTYKMIGYIKDGQERIFNNEFVQQGETIIGVVHSDSQTNIQPQAASDRKDGYNLELIIIRQGMDPIKKLDLKESNGLDYAELYLPAGFYDRNLRIQLNDNSEYFLENPKVVLIGADGNSIDYSDKFGKPNTLLFLKRKDGKINAININPKNMSSEKLSAIKISGVIINKFGTAEEETLEIKIR